jgi:hypothetical protein
LSVNPSFRFPSSLAILAATSFPVVLLAAPLPAIGFLLLTPALWLRLLAAGLGGLGLRPPGLALGRLPVLLLRLPLLRLRWCGARSLRRLLWCLLGCLLRCLLGCLLWSLLRYLLLWRRPIRSFASSGRRLGTDWRRCTRLHRSGRGLTDSWRRLTDSWRRLPDGLRWRSPRRPWPIPWLLRCRDD